MKKLILFATFAFILVTTLSSCSSYYSITSKMMNIELGMTKHEVVNIMGKDYIPYSFIKEGSVYKEVIAYGNLILPEGRQYLFYFSNGRLEKWQQEWVGSPYAPSEKKQNASNK